MTDIAEGSFGDHIDRIGQARLILSTVANAGATDKDYFYALGLAEGYLTAKRIIQQLYNVVWSKPRQDAYVYSFLASQYNYMRKNARDLWREDTFWFHVGLSLARMDGLMDGLKARQHEEIESLTRNGPPADLEDSMWPHYPVTYMALYELNSNTELGEILGSLAKDGDHVETGRFTDDTPSASVSESDVSDLRLYEHEFAEQTKCSALVKLVNIDTDDVDILVSHNTWTAYSEMLRIFKTFTFTHVQHPSFANRRFTMASYPGYLSSTDDWVSLPDTQILVTETTNECISKKRLRKYVVPDSVTTVIRSVVASVLSRTGEEWFDWFSRENSGTYNNQWILVDFHKFDLWKRSADRFASVPTDVLWIGEQAPGLVVSKDMTQHLFEETFWASYNRPYFTEIANVSGYSTASKLKGEWFHHQKCPRARMFAALHSAVTDVASMKSIMTLNRWESMNATYLHTHSCPKNQIAGRYDIDPHLDENTEDFKKCGPVMAYGALDCKISNSALMAADSTLIVSAPLWHNTAPAFNWSALPESAQSAHWGHPDVWDFPFVIWTKGETEWTPGGGVDRKLKLPKYVIGRTRSLLPERELVVS